jgi:hypothetical protein
MTMSRDRRRQIEEYLRRELNAEELVTVASLEDLSMQQRLVLDRLARQHRLAAWLYLEGVVADVTSREVMPIIDRIHEHGDISSDHILVLRPTFELDPRRIGHALEAMPGLFRHPTEYEWWVLPIRASMAEAIMRSIIERPHEATSATRVQRYVPGGAIVVIPGQTTADEARARKFVEMLLEMGPFELEVGGRLRGSATGPLDIYGCAPWQDPDISMDPTESPPRTGTLVTFYRDSGSRVREYLAIHDSGIVSYEQRCPIEDAEKTYRRIAPSHQALVRQLIAALPFLEEYGAGHDNTYLDLVFTSFERPSGDGRDAKLDATRPSPEATPFVRLVDEWVQALRRDRSAVIPGLEPCEARRSNLVAPSLTTSKQ